jgi:hypothetical protein
LQLNAVQALVVPACLLALGWRAQRAPTTRGWLYDAGQVALLVLVLASLGMLYSAVEHGLLRPPDMQILGDDSPPTNLAWYQDRSGSILPQPWMLSLPLYVYRAATLAWALWLAASALRWSRWIWGCFKQQGLWHPIAKPLLPPPGV